MSSEKSACFIVQILTYKLITLAYVNRLNLPSEKTVRLKNSRTFIFPKKATAKKMMSKAIAWPYLCRARYTCKSPTQLHINEKSTHAAQVLNLRNIKCQFKSDWNASFFKPKLKVNYCKLPGASENNYVQLTPEQRIYSISCCQI